MSGPANVATRDGPRLPLLVIDDHSADLESALVCLVRAGYPTAVAHDGDGALRRARAGLTRLVVSELYVACSEGPCVVAALARERASLPRLACRVYGSSCSRGT